MTIKRLCVIEPILTQYRIPVYMELSEHCHVDVIFSPAAPGSGFGKSTILGGARIRSLQIPTLRPFGNRNGLIQWGIAKYVWQQRPDSILISADPRYLSFWTTLFLGRLLGIPVFVHGHGIYKKRQIGFAYRCAFRLLLRGVTSYIAYAPIVRDAFCAHGFEDKNVSVAHNSQMNPCRVRPEEKVGNENGILFVGRLRRNCRVELLVRVIQRLRDDDGFPLTLHVVGSGEEAEELQNRSEGASWISWYGETYTPGELRAVSLECFVGAYPGNAGLSVVHMMSFSLPVVTHDDIRSHGPEASYIGNGVDGILFDHESPDEAMYQALRSLATDRKKVCEMQAAAFRKYQELVNPSLATRLWAIINGGDLALTDSRLSMASS